MPYEEITQAEYEVMAAKLKPLSFENEIVYDENQMQVEKFCDSDQCAFL